MKKAMFVFTAALAAWLLIAGSLGTPGRKGASKPSAKITAPASPAAIGPEASSKPIAIPAPAPDNNERLERDIARALEAAPPLRAFERQYLDAKRGELQRDLEGSKRFVASRRLIEKANDGSISADELRALAAEIRRQGVISQVLVRQDLERLKRKFL